MKKCKNEHFQKTINIPAHKDSWYKFQENANCKNNILLLLNFPEIIIIVLIVIILINSKIKLIISYFIQCIKYIQIYKFYIKTTIKMHKKYKYLKCF